ncbi:hypothetical protein Tco_1057030 [Tanacetum coccineum]|uniref:Uncharacterized protein n=1 Tax=Tanacetum coccineum TaxID=301880 RepID=A0ABQ5H6B9_9ASTR
MLGGCWIPEFSEDEEDDDHIKEFISSEQSDLGLHIDGEDNGASEVPETIFEILMAERDAVGGSFWFITHSKIKTKFKSD